MQLFIYGVFRINVVCRCWGIEENKQPKYQKHFTERNRILIILISTVNVKILRAGKYAFWLATNAQKLKRTT